MRKLLLCLWLGVSACESKPAVEPPPVALPTQPTKTVVAAAKPKATTAPTIDEAAARALVDRWREVQNSGDFAGYEALFAQQFRGQKRAGERLYRFDRAGWLKDRKQMFTRPFSIEIDDVRVRLGKASATVEFAQRFTQGTFSDHGPKLLVLVQEEGGIKIGSERMLTSRLLSDGQSLQEGGLAFVVHLHGVPYVVFEQGVDPRWGSGKLEKADLTDGVYAALKGAGSALPPGRAALRGKKLQVHQLDGRTCEATVSSLALLAAVRPDFFDECVFQGKDPENCTLSEPAQPHRRLEIARRLFELVMQSDLALVGKLENCDGSFAFAVEPTTKLDLWPLAKADAQLAERALAAARSTPMFRAMGKAHRDYLEGNSDIPDDWVNQSSVHSVAGRPDTLLVDLRASGGCADFWGSVTTLMEAPLGAAPRPLFSAPGMDAPAAVLDLGRDGKLEILSRNGEFTGSLVRVSKNAGVDIARLTHSFLGCGC